MQSQTLFPKSEADIQKEYKQKVFIQTLRDGKKFTRKCLFKNILYLSGLFRSLNQIGSVTIPTNSNYDRKYEIWFNHYPKTILENQKFINNLKRYLSDEFKIDDAPYYLTLNKFSIYFKYNSIRWDLIDYDLETNHPDNFMKKANGFVYVKNYRK